MKNKVRERPKAKLLEYLTKHEEELKLIFKEPKKNEYNR